MEGAVAAQLAGRAWPPVPANPSLVEAGNTCSTKTLSHLSTSRAVALTSGMAALVLPHVNMPQTGICEGQGGLRHRFPRSRKCEDASVRIVPHVSVEEEATWNLPNGRTHAV